MRQVTDQDKTILKQYTQFILSQQTPADYLEKSSTYYDQ